MINPTNPISNKMVNVPHLVTAQDEINNVVQTLKTCIEAQKKGSKCSEENKHIQWLPDEKALELFYRQASQGWLCGPAAVGLATIAATAAVAAATVGAVATLAAAKRSTHNHKPLELSSSVSGLSVEQLLALRAGVVN